MDHLDAEQGAGTQGSLLDSLGLDLDEADAARHKAERLFRHEAINIPKLRFIGLTLGLLVLYFHNRVILGWTGWREIQIFAAVLLVYCSLSWAVLYRWYGRTGSLDLGLVFLVLDVPIMLVGVHQSGLERSWLLPIMLMRVGDQAISTYRRALAFAHFVPLSYLAWVLVQPREVPWAQEVVKVGMMYGAGVYIALTAKVSDSLRHRVRKFIRLSREAILKLRENSEELAAARNKAEAASQAKTDFLSNMSHELRTPLNAILLYSEMVGADAREADQPELAGDMDKINGAGHHLLQLINNLLDMAKIEAGKMSLYLEDVSIPTLLEDVRTLAEPLVRKNRNTLKVEMAPFPRDIQGDLTRLKQILLNLLGNASKFTKDGTITLRFGPFTRKKQVWLKLQVSDTGIGMTPEQCEKLFQEFVQAEDSTSRKYGGTGLGLALSLKLAQLMEGGITVQSEVGQGTTFTVEFPFLPPLAVRDPKADPAFGPGRKRILVIEDDPDFREGLARLLGTEDYDILAADSGELGFEMARLERPDLITLDVMLPGLSGWELLTALKADPDLANIPVILLTLSEDRSKGFALGAADFLLKPLSTSSVDGIRRHLTARPGGEILVVEDDAPLRKALARSLEREGWKTREAGDGRAALACLEGGWMPDLILLDLQLPEMDGFEFLEALRQGPAWKDLPVVVATGMDLGEGQREFLTRHQIRDVLTKGALNREELFKAIREMALARTRS